MTSDAEDMVDVFIDTWCVDEVIEAVEYSKAGISTERWREIELALLRLAPRAYQKQVTLRDIWPNLDDTMRKDIYRGYMADYWPGELQ